MRGENKKLCFDIDPFNISGPSPYNYPSRLGSEYASASKDSYCAISFHLFKSPCLHNLLFSTILNAPFASTL